MALHNDDKISLHERKKRIVQILRIFSKALEFMLHFASVADP